MLSDTLRPKENIEEYNKKVEKILNNSTGFLVFKQCPEGICVAADTQRKDWKTQEVTNIHKISYDKDKKAIFAMVGNTTRYTEAGPIFAEQLATDMLPLVGQYDDLAILTWVHENLINFLRDPSSKAIRNVQYLYYHYGAKPDIYSVMVSYPNQLTPYGYDSIIHKDSYACGYDSCKYNDRHLQEDNTEKTLEDIKKQCIDAIQGRIDNPKFPTVGGKVEWITIDKDGNVETNIED